MVQMSKRVAVFDISTPIYRLRRQILHATQKMKLAVSLGRRPGIPQCMPKNAAAYRGESMKPQLEHSHHPSAKHLWDDLVAVASLAALGAIVASLVAG